MEDEWLEQLQVCLGRASPGSQLTHVQNPTLRVPGDSGVTTDLDRSIWWPLQSGLLLQKERRPRPRNPKGKP